MFHLELTFRPSWKDSWRFVQKNGHQRLWQLLAHGALQKLDLAIAKQSFANFADIYGVYFVRKLEVFFFPRLSRQLAHDQDFNVLDAP